MRSDAQLNREYLLDVAQSLVSGDRAPTLNELARHTGLGVATVYRHFPDASALGAALMEKPLQALQALCERAIGEQDALAALRALFLGVLELELDNPLAARLIHAPETTSESVRQVLADMQVAARNLVARAHRKRAIRASVSGEDICHLLHGVHAAALASNEPAAAARRYVDIIFAGIAPQPRATKR
jgi:AcrR family transcriptional regulator